MEFTHSGEVESLPIILSTQEWGDIAHMVKHYLMCTEWVTRPREVSEYGRISNGVSVSSAVADIKRRRELAGRITNAT